MTYIYHIIKYLFLLNKREPVSFLFNLVLPLGVFLGILLYHGEEMNSFADALDFLFTLVGYTIYSTAAYGVGITFADWRESGIFLTFCKDRRALWRLLTGQAFLRALASAAYVATFIACAALYFQSPPSPIWIALPLASFGLSLGAGFFSLGLLLLPISPRDTGSIVSISLFCFLALNGLTFHGNADNPLIHLINLLNPINWSAVLLDALISRQEFLSFAECLRLAISACLFFLVGVLGLARFRPHPVLARL